MRLLQARVLPLLLFLPIPISGQPVDRGLRGSYPIITVEGKVYVGTPQGLRGYDIEEDDWMVIPLPGGEEANRVGLLGSYRSILWAGTEGGVSNADLRLGDWILYDSSSGLGDNRALSLAFEEDYVWVGTRAGASRFDELSQEWRRYGEEDGLIGGVRDIAVHQGTVWFATGGGVVEWDPEFEAWRVHEEASPAASRGVDFVRATGEYLWFFGQGGAVRFNKGLRSWAAYGEQEGVRGYQINDLALAGDSIWMATSGGVSIYDPESDRWDQFPEERHLPSKDVRSIVVTDEEIWFGTSEGIARYDRSTRGWRRYSVAQGMSSPQVMTIELYSNILFATTEGSIDYFKLSEDRWYSLPISTLEGRKREWLSLSEEEGARLQLSPQLGAALRGRTTYQVNVEDGSDAETKTRSDLRLVGDLPDGRAGYGFYNDTEPEGVKYGVKYRGADDDLLREVALGDLTCDLGRAHLIRSLGLYGEGVELGWRREHLTHSRTQIRLTGWKGDRTTGFETDLFVGKSRRQVIDALDIDYVKGTYYMLDTTTTLLPLLPKSESVWVDDRVDANNTPNTSENKEIGGILGDFDLFQPGEDYLIDYQKGILRFIAPRPATDVITVQYEFSGGGGGRWEGVIQDEANRRFELLNRYSLGGAEIIPHSLSAQVLDLDGIEQSLSDFGLDSDMDGVIDSDLVDFDRGVLYSLYRRPFPEEVYSPSDPVHLYTIHVEYETRSPLFTLSHQKLIRESEAVLVDGRSLRRGEEYVVDYTSGYLLVLEEELIGERSEVEVSYEYWAQSDEGFGSAGAEAQVAENLNVGVIGVQFREELEDTSSHEVNLIDASTELRFNTLGLRVRLPVELAQSTSGKGTGRAHRSEVLASSDRLRLQGLYELWDERFRSLLTRPSKLGLLTKRWLLSTEYRVRSYLPFSLTWKSQSSAPDDTAAGGREENIQGTMWLSRRDYPVLGVSGGLNSTHTSLASSRRKVLTGHFEYELTKALSSRLPLRALKVNSYLSRTWEDTRPDGGSPRESIYDAGLLGLRLSPARDIEVNSSFRHELSKKQSDNESQSEPTSALQELVLSSRCDRVPGFSLFLRAEGRAREEFLPEGAPLRDLSLERRRELGLEIYPGMWVGMLSPLTLELDWGSNWTGYLAGLGRDLQFGGVLWEELPSEEITRYSYLRRQALRGELRPRASLLLSSGYQRLLDEQTDLGTTLERFTQLYTNRLEVTPRFRSVLTADLNLEEETIGVKEKVRAIPTLRWEERWGQNFLSKLSLSYWCEKSEEGNIEASSAAVTPSLGITLRYDRVWVLGAMDLSDDFSVSYSEQRTWTGETSNTQYSSQLKLELRPTKVVKVRTRLGLVYDTNASQPVPDALSSTFSLRLSAHF